LSNDGVGEFGGGGSAHQVGCAQRRGQIHLMNSLLDLISILAQVQVPEHHASRERQGSGVGSVLSSDIVTNVT